MRHPTQFFRDEGRFVPLVAIQTLAMLITSLSCSASLAQTGAFSWNGQLSGLPLMYVQSMTLHDFDGPGPQLPSLVVCEKDASQIAIIAYRNGEWTTLFRTILSNSSIPLLTSFDPDGPRGPSLPQLLVANAHHLPSYNLARLEGSTLVPIGLQSSNIADMTVWDSDGPGPVPPRLFAVGSSLFAVPNITSTVLAWDGATWSQLGLPSSSTATSVTIFDPDGDGPGPSQLAVGGRFDALTGRPFTRVALYDGSRWSPIEMPPNLAMSPTHLTSHDPDGSGPARPLLIASDSFFASWDGSRWTNLPGHSSMLSFGITASFDPDGSGPELPQLIGGGRGSRLSRWTGTTWQSIDPTTNLSSIYGMIPHDPDGEGPGGSVLFVACHPGSRPSPIGMWDGSRWQNLHRTVLDPIVNVFTFDADGPGTQPRKLYIQSASSSSFRSIRSWNGFDWEDESRMLSSGNVDYFVFDLDGTGQQREEIFVLSPSYLSWSSEYFVSRYERPGIFRRVSDLLAKAPTSFQAFDPDGPGIEKARPFFGFSNPDPFNAAVTDSILDSILELREGRWVRLQSQHATEGPFAGVDVPTAMISFDHDNDPATPLELVVAGQFRRFDKTQEPAAAIWRGDRWERLGSRLTGDLRSLEYIDLDGAGPQSRQLVAGGSLLAPGAVRSAPAVTLADGVWVAMLEDALSPVLASVTGFTSYDPDGFGPAPSQLVASGQRSIASGGGAGLFGWTGQRWEAMGGAMSLSLTSYSSVSRYVSTGSPAIDHVIPFDPDGDGPIAPHLITTGNFVDAGTIRSPFIAAIGPTGNWASAFPSIDFFPDGLRNDTDVHYFQRYFDGQNPVADLGREGGEPGPDGVVDQNDWVVFIRRYLMDLP